MQKLFVGFLLFFSSLTAKAEMFIVNEEQTNGQYRTIDTSSVRIERRIGDSREPYLSFALNPISQTPDASNSDINRCSIKVNEILAFGFASVKEFLFLVQSKNQAVSLSNDPTDPIPNKCIITQVNPFGTDLWASRHFSKR